MIKVTVVSDTRIRGDFNEVGTAPEIGDWESNFTPPELGLCEYHAENDPEDSDCEHPDCPGCQWELTTTILSQGKNATFYIEERRKRGLPVPQFLLDAVQRGKEIEPLLALHKQGPEGRPHNPVDVPTILVS